MVRINPATAMAMVATLRAGADAAEGDARAVSRAAAQAGVSVGLVSRVQLAVEGLRRRADELSGRVDLAVAADAARSGLAGSGSTDGGWVSYATPGQDDYRVEELGAAVGTELGRAAAGVDLSDPGTLAWLSSTVQRYQGNADVAVAFFDRLGPSGALDVMTRVALSGPSMPGQVGGQQRASMVALKAFLGAADAAWTPAQRTQFADALVCAATGQDTAVDPLDDSGRFGQALSYLLHDSHYSDDFLRSVADGLDRFERMVGPQQYGGQFSASDWWAGSWSGPNVWAGYVDPTPGGTADSASWDPSVSLMGALADNPKVGLSFFTDGSTGRVASARQTYWLATRDWGQDNFSALTAALAAASTDPRVLDDPTLAPLAATLASATVNLLGSRGDLSREVLTNDDGPGGASENLATILATYTTGIGLALQHGPPVGPDVASADHETSSWFSTGKLTNVPKFNEDALQNLVVLSTGTDSGMAIVRAGLDVYAAQKYAVALGELNSGASDAKNFKNALDDQAAVEGFVAHAVGRSDIDRAVTDWARTQRWVGLANDAVAMVPYANLVKYVATGAGQTVVMSFALDQGVDAVKASATAQVGSPVGEAVDSANIAAGQGLLRAELAVVTAMVASGNMPADTAGLLRDKDGQVVTWAHFDDLSNAAWMAAVDNDDGVGRTFDVTRFEGVYRDQFMQYFSEEKG